MLGVDIDGDLDITTAEQGMATSRGWDLQFTAMRKEPALPPIYFTTEPSADFTLDDAFAEIFANRGNEPERVVMSPSAFDALADALRDPSSELELYPSRSDDSVDALAYALAWHTPRR